MTTMRNCVEPENGWYWLQHTLSNILACITSERREAELVKEKENADQKINHENIIDKYWAEIVGKVYMIMTHMIKNGHDEDYAKMHEFLNLLVSTDVSDIKTHQIIKETFDKLKR